MKRCAPALLLSLVAALPLAMHASAAREATTTAVAAHVLNRVAFGPRPGDIERVQQVGAAAYIDEQLHPERIKDDALAERLAGMETLALNSREIAARYEVPLLLARRDAKQASGQAGGSVPADAGQPTREQQQHANLPMVELSEQKLLRAVYSERQLQEVLTDFWFNHFNVDARKGPSRFMLTEYEREAIRPHVLGKFRDLLEATAKSPAMLFYLDNWMSADPAGPHPPDGPNREARAAQMRRMIAANPQMQNRMPKGLNENYGRELLELHTLGVDGGYTQKDVTEVARAFTGWTITTPRMGGGYRFEARLHDEGEKTVLGHRIKAGGGESDGEAVLDLLARHPSTARFISTKLAKRFVSDTPPDALIDRLAARFRETDGDLRAVMTTLLTSPEFMSPAAQQGKVKNPFEFIVSAARATGAEVINPRPLVGVLQQLGMPPYQCQPPTGYKDEAATWVNTGALVSRMNVALSLADGKLPGVKLQERVDPESLVPGGFSEATRATLARATTAPQALALALGSPEFQRR